MISNAPPSDLVIFAKSLAAKLAGTKNQPRMSTRAKLHSDIASFTEGISPVTAKVIKGHLIIIFLISGPARIYPIFGGLRLEGKGC